MSPHQPVPLPTLQNPLPGCLLGLLTRSPAYAHTKGSAIGHLRLTPLFPAINLLPDIPSALSVSPLTLLDLSAFSPDT